jgi:hypothetical protein
MFVYNNVGGDKMLKDRGTIKWTSLMLPEHVEQLKQLWEESKLADKPILDEQQLEKLNANCTYALHNKVPISLTYYQQGKEKNIEGQIKKLDSQKNLLYLRTNNHEVIKIPLTNILNITNTTPY